MGCDAAGGGGGDGGAQRALRRGERPRPPLSPQARLRFRLSNRALPWHVPTPPGRFMHRQLEPVCLADDGIAAAADHKGDCEHARATRPLLFEDFHFLRCPKVSHAVLPGRIYLFDHVLFSAMGKEARCARARRVNPMESTSRFILYQKQRFDTINFHHGCMVFTCESCKFSPRLEPGNFHYA